MLLLHPENLQNAARETLYPLLSRQYLHMNWITKTFLEPSAVQAVTIICLICAVGLGLGKLRFRGISLSVTFVFFSGILAGALGLKIDPQMLVYAESFGLVMFVYCLGLQVGPGFVAAFKQGGTELNLMSIGVVAIGSLLAVGLAATGLLPFGEMVGVLCGATTNTPALGAAQQTMHQIGQPSAVAALSCAVTYAVGVVGVIIVLVVTRRWVHKHEKSGEDSSSNQAFIASFLVCNPAIFGRSIHEVVESQNVRFVVSRLWRDGKVMLPGADTELNEGDRLLVITKEKHVGGLTILFGQHDNTDWMKHGIDWNTLDTKLHSKHILITRSEINGRHLGSLHLRNRYGVNVSRVKRSGIQLVATPDLVLRLGDRLTVIGSEESLEHVAKELGNTLRDLDSPNLIAIFIGIVCGLVLGSIPLSFGLSAPVCLGLAGGPIVMGIIIGAYGPRINLAAYTTTSANLMIRSLGLSMYLACLGLDAGADFVQTVMQPDALAWIGYALMLSIVPLVAVTVFATLMGHKCYATIAGMLCGAMANPIALDYVNSTQDSDKASIAYATVYPLAMFLRVIIAQLLVMLWFA